jgi:hypothetical protein
MDSTGMGAAGSADVSTGIDGIKAFLGRLFTELNKNELDRLEQLAGSSENARREAVEFICRPDRLEQYQRLCLIDDYDPIHYCPYHVLARIGQDSERAMEACLEGMWNDEGFAKMYAMEALPKVAPPQMRQRAVSEISIYLDRLVHEDGENPRFHSYASSAVLSLLMFGKEGCGPLKKYIASQNNGFQAIRNGIRSGLAHIGRTDRNKAAEIESAFAGL